jgi:hypothetical protein
VFVVRSVRMWLGTTGEEPGEGALRPLESLCGLRFLDCGFDEGLALSGERQGVTQRGRGLRLATSGGLLV